MLLAALLLAACAQAPADGDPGPSADGDAAAAPAGLDGAGGSEPAPEPAADPAAAPDAHDAPPVGDHALIGTWRCGGEEVSLVRAADGSVLLERPGELLLLRPVEAASGAKYAAVDDPGTWAWEKAGALTLQWRGQPRHCEPPAGPDAYRAVGQEPGWSLLIEADRLVLTEGYGETRTELAAPPAATALDGGGRRWDLEAEGGALVVEITPGPCADTMSGMPYPDAVRVTRGDATLRGCGGEPASLLAGDWRVERLGGEAPPAGVEITLAFDAAAGRVSGRGGCNRYTGPFALTGEGLAIGPLAMTRMACPGPAMAQEQAFAAAIAGVTGFSIAEDGALVLRAGDAEALRARR
jgi:heat shock protein HslJ